MSQPQKHYKVSLYVKSDRAIHPAKGVHSLALENGFTQLSKVVTKEVADLMLSLNKKRPEDTVKYIARILMSPPYENLSLSNPAVTSQ